MVREMTHALVACLATFLLCAVAYPAVVWGLGHAAFPHQAEGSLVRGPDGAIIGSELIAQPFVSDRYFFPRPSAVAYKADAAGGSNLGPKNPELRKAVAERARALKATRSNPAPVDLVTASGGGIDPHISPEAAYYQVPRVAAARKMAERELRAFVDGHIEHSGAIIGAPARINVLRLNLDLDREKPSTAVAQPVNPRHAAAPGPPAPVAETGATGAPVSRATPRSSS
jgi:K+-transporting ATPase ATPase C chain